jgi:hypothetical protein
MAQQGSKGSKGPNKVVAGKDGSISQVTAESHGGSLATPKKPGGTRGTKGGAR